MFENGIHATLKTIVLKCGKTEKQFLPRILPNIESLFVHEVHIYVLVLANLV